MANLSNINNKFLVTTGGNVLIGQTAAVGSSIKLQVTGNSTFTGDVYATGISNSNVVISRDNMYVDAGQFYIGADDGSTDDSFRQRTASGSYFIESRKSGTWTNRLQINTAGTLIVQQGMAISGNIDGVGATFIGTAASGAPLVTIENNSGSTATSYGLLVKGGGNSASGKTFEVRDDSGNTDLIVKGNSNVGIGTSSPFTNLEVAGSGLDSIIRLYAAGGTANIRTWEIRAVGVAGEGLLFRQVNDANNSYTNRMIIDTDGNVGIGTISPNDILDVRSASWATRIQSTVDGTYLRISPNQIATFNSANAGSPLYINNSSSGNIIMAGGGGYVGIGITNPQSKLHVNGGAIIGSTRFGDSATASIGTTGYIVANVPASTNGQSAIVEFVASGGGGAYYNVVYACYNGGGAWYYTKNVVGSGGNIEVAETNGSGSSTLVFYFRATSSSASYTPRVMMRGTPYALVTF